MFDIHVISLKSSDRRKSISKALGERKVSFRFENAFDARTLSDSEFEASYDDVIARRRYGRSLTRGEVACFISHRSVWQQIAKSGRAAIVLEDDAILEPAFFDRVLNSNERALASTADVLLLGHSKLRRALARRSYLLEPLKRAHRVGALTVGFPFKQWTSGTVGYWISAEGARRMCAHADGAIGMLVDDWPWHRDHGNVCVAELRPYAVWEGFESMPSSIEAARRENTRGRAMLHEAALWPLRILRAIARWATVALLILSARRGKRVPNHE
jgi:glycosyl transferase family 25